MVKKIKIIAEIGVNHNGKLKLAKKLIDEAKKAGADYIKFQSFNPEMMVTKNLDLAEYQKKQSGSNRRMLDMLNHYKLDYETQLNLSKYCKRKDIEFISSPFDINSLDFLVKKIKVKTIKIASGEITNYPLLKKIAGYKKKIILSSGMSNMHDILIALNILIKGGVPKKKITLLQCTSSYPTPINDLNLNILKSFKKRFNVKVGLSDHSTSIYAPMIAVALGGELIEKHITLNKKLPGPDHKSSLTPKEFKQMVEKINEVRKMLGSKE